MLRTDHRGRGISQVMHDELMSHRGEDRAQLLVRRSRPRLLPLTAGTGGKETGDIYAVRFGNSEADSAVSGLTNGGIQATDLGEAHDKPVYRTRIEFYCGIAMFGGKAAARLMNVLNG